MTRATLILIGPNFDHVLLVWKSADLFFLENNKCGAVGILYFIIVSYTVLAPY